MCDDFGLKIFFKAFASNLDELGLTVDITFGLLWVSVERT